MQTRSASAFALLLLTATVGCTAAPVDLPLDRTLATLAPPPPGEGVQFAMHTRVKAETDAEHCKFVRAPAEGMWVNRDRVQRGPGVHDVLLFETSYDDFPDTTVDGVPADTSDVIDCSDGAVARWAVTRVIAGTPNTERDSMLSFPADVGLYIPPGAVLLLKAHHVNTTSYAQSRSVRINLYSMNPEDVAHEGDVLRWSHPFVYVAPMSSGVAHMRCPIAEDITLVSAHAHMHARGTEFLAAVTADAVLADAASNDLTTLDALAEGIDIRAGSSIEARCEYLNSTNDEVTEGPRATDEKCMLVGAYYPRHDPTTACGDADANPNMGADWIGSGDHTCLETLICAMHADHDSGAVGACLAAAQPDVAATASNAVRCLYAERGAEDINAACEKPFDACVAL